VRLISFPLAFSNWSHRARSEIVSCRGGGGCGASFPRRARTMPRSRFAGEKKPATEIAAGLGIRRCSLCQSAAESPPGRGCIYFLLAHELVCMPNAQTAPTSLNINGNQTETRAAAALCVLCRPLQIACFAGHATLSTSVAL
jgi:hypothetical protein